jgi:hypothetical protein
MMLALAAHGVVGRKLGPFEPRYAFDSLVVNAEDKVAIMQGRLWATCKAHNMDHEIIINSNHIHLFDDRSNLTLVEVQSGQIVIPARTIKFFDEKMTKYPHIRVFFLDPLGQMMGSGINENDNAQMGIVMRLMVWLARRYNISNVIGTHVPKRLMENKEFDPTSLDNIRGASAITGRARLVTAMWPQTFLERAAQGLHPDVMSLRFIKSSYSWFPKDAYWFQRRSEFTGISNDGIHRDSYSTLETVDGANLIGSMEKRFINIIGQYLIQFQMTVVGPEMAAEWILNFKDDMPIAGDDIFSQGTKRSMADKLRKMFGRGARTFPYTADSGDTYIMSLDVTQPRSHQIVMLPTNNKLVLPRPILPPS